jgi:predicted N-acetyltransferase YhbS
MPLSRFVFTVEDPSHDATIEEINAEAFGPGRYTRAAYRIREAGSHDRSLSFVALNGEEVVASVRMTPVAAGEGRAMLLGPLAVRPDFKNLGIGRKLVDLAVEAARKQGDVPAVLLVGDEPYYGPLGFHKVASASLEFPAPVDLGRVLVRELEVGGADRLRGVVNHAALPRQIRKRTAGNC